MNRGWNAREEVKKRNQTRENHSVRVIVFWSFSAAEYQALLAWGTPNQLESACEWRQITLLIQRGRSGLSALDLLATWVQMVNKFVITVGMEFSFFSSLSSNFNVSRLASVGRLREILLRKHLIRVGASRWQSGRALIY